MKKILSLGLFLSINLSAMEGPSKKARTDSEEVVSSREINVSQEEGSAKTIRIIPTLSQLAATTIIQNYFSDPTKTLNTAFPENFFILPNEMQEYLIAQPLPNRMERTWLHEARTPEDIDTFLRLASAYGPLREEMLINQHDELGNTALNSFIQSGRLDLAHHLLRNSPLVNSETPNYKLLYPFEGAVIFQDQQLLEEILKKIINRGQEVRAKGDEKEIKAFFNDQISPLIRAIRAIIPLISSHYLPTLIEFFKSNGFPINSRLISQKKEEPITRLPFLPRAGRSLLHELNSVEDIDAFLDQVDQSVDNEQKKKKIINNQDKFGNTAFNSFLQAGRLDLAHHLLDKSSLVDATITNNQSIHPLTMAIFFRDEALAKKIIDQIIKKNESKLLNLIKNLNIQESSYEEGPGSRATLRSVTYYALTHLLPEILKILHSNGAKLDPELYSNNNPFIVLMNRYNDKDEPLIEEIINYLTSTGYDINSRGEDSQTALMELIDSMTLINKEVYPSALTFATQKMFNFLIAKGLDINAIDAENRSALMYATLYNPLFIPLLIALGANETLVRTKIVLSEDNSEVAKEETALDILERRFPQFVDLYHESLRKRNEEKENEAAQLLFKEFTKPE